MAGPGDLDARLAALPHGPEFRFVEELIAIEPGVAGRGRLRVRGDESFLAGHFPGDPMLPGVLMIEAIAQLAGIIAQAAAGPPLADLRLAAVRHARIHAAVRPGALLEIEAAIEGRIEGLVQARGALRDGDTLVATAHVTLAGSPRIHDCAGGELQDNQRR